MICTLCDKIFTSITNVDGRSATVPVRLLLHPEVAGLDDQVPILQDLLNSSLSASSFNGG